MSVPEGTATAPGLGAEVVDARGREVGAIVAVAVDPRGRTVDWLIVAGAAGRLAGLPSYVASVREDGRVVLPFTRELIAAAPPVTSELLTQDLIDALHVHYGLA